MIDDEMSGALANFFVEAAELLSDIETGLLGLEESEGDEESVNAVFRAAHTIKGSAGLFGLDEVVRFTHGVESVLDRLRAHEIPFSRDLVGVLLPCKDQIAALIESAAQGQASPRPELTASGIALSGSLARFLDADFDAGISTGASDGAQQDGARLVLVSVRFGADCLRNGMDPISFIQYLGSLGEMVSVLPLTELLPDVEDMDAETCYLAFAIVLRTSASIESIEGVFEFVRDESDIRVLTGDSPRGAFGELVQSFDARATEIADLLVAIGGRELGAVADASSERDAGPEQLASGELEARPTAATSDKQIAEVRTIRVDAARLDRLIDTVGEMVIAGAGAGLHASMSENETLKTAIAEVMRLIEGVRDDALRLRMVPIGTTFGRFQRVVRDVSASLGKDVQLSISGGETEVDKALVEQIGDPLMHLVRNALDHGIEAPEVRVERGKPRRGSLVLRASHDSGSIVVEVEDDGGGIDTKRVLAKAIERKLVDPSATLTDKEICSLIFEPGFSTAAQVSDLSGRGVGMDVVKRNVTSLRGTIDVDNRPGLGMTVRIRLPLTLAIIDGFMVGVGPTTFVIPLDRVVECVECPASAARHDYMDLRGEVLPLIRLRSLMSVDGDRPRRENVVVVEQAGSKAGLVVDTLQGEFQTVIKPLGAMFAQAEGIGGSTILGNGEVALIIDVPMLVRAVIARTTAQFYPARG